MIDSLVYILVYDSLVLREKIVNMLMLCGAQWEFKTATTKISQLCVKPKELIWYRMNLKKTLSKDSIDWKSEK